MFASDNKWSMKWHKTTKQDYVKSIDLLREYVGTNSLLRFFNSHRNRHHINLVTAILKEYNNEQHHYVDKLEFLQDVIENQMILFTSVKQGHKIKINAQGDFYKILNLIYGDAMCLSLRCDFQNQKPEDFYSSDAAKASMTKSRP